THLESFKSCWVGVIEYLLVVATGMRGPPYVSNSHLTM
ncbi:hypothetical protein A2U01_0025539, partial [Trifolium medium]|nr:hypothetical protein [Trifolium medium]